MYAKSVSITLHPDHNFASIALAKVIKDISTLPLLESLDTAKYLLKGESWNPDPSTFKITTEQARDPNFHKGWFIFQLEEYPCPYDEQIRQWNEQRALLRAGAAGDVEAAIKYCKLELDGEVNHSAMG